jgi:hypothetical protein
MHGRVAVAIAVGGLSLLMVPPLVVNEIRTGRAPSRSESVPAAVDSPE